MSQYEKPEKEEKDEKGGQGQSMEEKWARDPLGTAVGAVILIWLGVTLLAANTGLTGLVDWSNMWAWFLLGLGAILLLEALVRLVIPEFRRPVVGRIIGGIVLLLIGATGTSLPFLRQFNIETWWPLIPIVAGVLILLAGLFRRRG